MYEYEMMNKTTKERTFIWGYNLEDAISRAQNFNPDEWECIGQDYVG